MKITMHPVTKTAKENKALKFISRFLNDSLSFLASSVISKMYVLPPSRVKGYVNIRADNYLKK
jgi:hypothetical protein